MEIEQYIATFQNVLDDETCDKCDCAYCEHGNALDEFWKNLKDGTYL